MPFEDTVILGIIGINIILTLILVVIYLRNYKAINSKLTLGFAFVVLAFLVQNLANFWFYNSLIAQGITFISAFHFTVNLIQMIGLSILVWITWK